MLVGSVSCEIVDTFTDFWKLGRLNFNLRGASCRILEFRLTLRADSSSFDLDFDIWHQFQLLGNSDLFAFVLSSRLLAFFLAQRRSEVYQRRSSELKPFSRSVDVLVSWLKLVSHFDCDMY